MIVPGDRIVAGVSGGADSVCLLFLLLAYAEKVPFFLTVVHVNHGIRADAGEDARYVEELCVGRSIPFRLAEADVHRLAQERKCSEEDAGRQARYEAFRQVAEETGSCRIAVAHNSNDNAETMLFHLFRGSGINGLSGIPPMREDAADSGGASCRIRVIRPLLCLERREAEEYLRGRHIPWRTDSTNETDDYSRNRIRHHILSCAEREVCAGTIGHMRQAAELLRETEDFLERQTRTAMEACVEAGLEDSGRKQRYVIDAAAFQGLHVVLQKRVLFDLMKRLSPTGKDISSVHVRDAAALFSGEGVRSLSLPFGITALRQYGKVILERSARIGGKPQEEAAPGIPRLPLGSPVAVPPAEELFARPFVCDMGAGGKMEFSVFFCKKGQEFPKNQYTKWFDCDKIKESPVIRSRKEGDFLTISRGWHKSLKDYMVTEKIPRQIRDSIPVLASGSHVLWLVGWRISEYFKVDGNTERILQVRFFHETSDEGCGDSGTEEKNV